MLKLRLELVDPLRIVVCSRSPTWRRARQGYLLFPLVPHILGRRMMKMNHGVVLRMHHMVPKCILTLIPPRPKHAVTIKNAFASQPTHAPSQLARPRTPALALATASFAVPVTCVVTQQRRDVHCSPPAQIVPAPPPTMRRVGVLAAPPVAEECSAMLLPRPPLRAPLRHVRSL